ncbi:MAG: polymerase sigma-70 factor, subfamily [Steroidobacteraceae bacterium]|nr:polymerase sigma-70 factor, subfamily [Steroidobacteraceae bacterium]MBM2854935.1 polymerase sigma-70 factor, subfamily [Steroidobacteraceae bacterium]
MIGSATLSWPTPLIGGRVTARETALDQERALERFLAGIEKRAFRIAKLSLRDHDDALDVVQDAMISLARNYAGHPEEQWRPLFYRILRNRITDYQRRRRVRQGVIAWWPGTANDDGPPDPVESAPDPSGTPDQQLEGEELLERIGQVLAGLSGRQREAFMLRNFEGLDVAQTAIAMGCSEGSVKTHYFRAVQALQQQLGGWQS